MRSTDRSTDLGTVPDPATAGSGTVICSGLYKRYGPTVSLNDVSVTFESGLIHGLVGENGAGKSTLVGVVSGRVAADRGQVLLGETAVPLGHTGACRRLGIMTVYQELSLVGNLTALENLFLGAELSHFGGLRTAEMRRQFAEIAQMLGIEALLRPSTKVGDMPLASQQMLEIMRAVLLEARLVMLDEPSASLGSPEREVLHAIIRRLKSAGKNVVVVSHDLDEVLYLSDDVTVMRDGHVIAQGPTTEWDKARLILAMTGRELDRGARRTSPASAEPVVRVRHVTLARRVRDVSFELHASEIVGLWGLVGAGRTSLLRSLIGAEPAALGELSFNGEWQPLPRNTDDAIESGVVLLPEDRRSSLFGKLSVRDNIFVRQSRRGLKPSREERAAATRLAEEFGFAQHRLDSPASTLSGGNQQKVLLMRAASWKPRVLFLDEPTRGIDVGAKAEVFGAVEKLAGEGMCCLLSSSDLEDIAHLCTRMLVMAQGRIVAELSGKELDDADEQWILQAGFNRSEGAG